MRHTSFNTWASIGYLFAPEVTTADDGWNSLTGYKGYQLSCRIVADFLDTKIKQSAPAQAALSEDVASDPGAQMTHRNAIEPPPSSAELMDIANKKGLAAARAVVERFKELEPNSSIVDAGHLNNLGYFLIFQNKLEGAINAFLLVTYAYPTSANAFDSLGDGYVAARQKEKAREAFETAIRLAPTDATLSEDGKASLVADDKKKISELR